MDDKQFDFVYELERFYEINENSILLVPPSNSVTLRNFSSLPRLYSK